MLLLRPQVTGKSQSAITVQVLRRLIYRGVICPYLSESLVEGLEREPQEGPWAHPAVKQQLSPLWGNKNFPLLNVVFDGP